MHIKRNPASTVKFTLRLTEKHMGADIKRAYLDIHLNCTIKVLGLLTPLSLFIDELLDLCVRVRVCVCVCVCVCVHVCVCVCLVCVCARLVVWVCSA